MNYICDSMIVEKNTYNDPDGTIGWIETIFDSSNILYTTYFPKTKILYIAFARGGVYSYINVDQEFYDRFETTESQGKFFVSEIKNNPKYPYQKSFKLFESEISRAKVTIEKWKKNKEENQQ